MMQVTIENDSGNFIQIIGRPRIHIPAHAVGEKAVTVSFQNDVAGRAQMERLRREHPYLRIAYHKRGPDTHAPALDKEPEPKTAGAAAPQKKERGREEAQKTEKGAPVPAEGATGEGAPR